MGLYASGLAAWNAFFAGGVFPYNFHDWVDIAAPRLFFLKDALARGVLPLHIAVPSALGGVTDRYLAVPNTLISPQVLLLGVLDVGHFVLANQILFYTIAFLGLLWFRRKFSLSPLAFTALFLLFNFNGHIVAHLSVGHFSWEGYYLFPWFAALMVRLFEGDRSWSWVAKTALVMLAVFLQGAFHQFVWMLIFLALIALTSWKYFIPVFKASLFAGLVSLFRLLPPVLQLAKFTDTYKFFGGYPTVSDIWQAMTSLQQPAFAFNSTYASSGGLGYWEFDLYVGLIGAVFLVFFGLYRWLWKRETGPKYYGLAIPMLIMAALSLGNVFQFLESSSIPLLEGERVSARMISLPFVFLSILAAIEFQRWLDGARQALPAQVAQIALFGVGAYDLWQNFSAWQVAHVAQAFKPSLLTPGAWYATNVVDPPYIRILVLGASGSVAALMLLLGGVLFEKSRQPVPNLPARRIRVPRRPILRRGRLTTWALTAPTTSRTVAGLRMVAHANPPPAEALRFCRLRSHTARGKHASGSRR